MVSKVGKMRGVRCFSEIEIWREEAELGLSWLANHLTAQIKILC